MATVAESELRYRRLVARRLRAVRVDSGVTQLGLAVRVGDGNRNFVSGIERAAMTVDAWRLSRIADALGVELAWLLDPRDRPIVLNGAQRTAGGGA